jgi:hypothetical protein
MRKLSVLTALIAGFCFFGIMQVQAAEQSITVTVSLESSISVSLDKTAWVIGPKGLGATAGPEAFVATVGNTPTKLEIKGADGAGGWTIGTPVGADKFEVAVTDPAITLTKVNQTLAASVAAYGTKSFSLTYKSPSSDTKGAGVAQGFAITVTASATP